VSNPRNHEHGATLLVRVVTNASKNEIAGEQDGRLVIRLTASPVDGKANKLLIKFLSKQLKVAASRIAILHGLTSREKTLLFHGLDEHGLREKLEALA
jgi:uncharacterized protein (TIGR00251 family)